MNQFSEALARDHLTVMDGALRPAALEMRDAFDAWMTAHSTDLPSARQRQENDRSNVQVLSRLAGSLPGVLFDYSGTSSELRPLIFNENANDLVAAQASTVFHNPGTGIPDMTYGTMIHPKPYQPKYPYYVLGMNSNDSSLLLAAPAIYQKIPSGKHVAHTTFDFLHVAKARNRKPGILGVYNDGFFGLPTTNRGRTKRLMQVYEHLKVTNHVDEIIEKAAQDQLYNRDLSEFTFDHGSLGSFTLQSYHHPLPVKYLSDEQMGEFNVFDNLVRVATAFPNLHPARVFAPEPKSIATIEIPSRRSRLKSFTDQFRAR